MSYRITNFAVKKPEGLIIIHMSTAILSTTDTFKLFEKYK